jgi:hypothetical protein
VSEERIQYGHIVNGSEGAGVSIHSCAPGQRSEMVSLPERWLVGRQISRLVGRIGYDKRSLAKSHTRWWPLVVSLHLKSKYDPIGSGQWRSVRLRRTRPGYGDDLELESWMRMARRLLQGAAVPLFPRLPALLQSRGRGL